MLAILLHMRGTVYTHLLGVVGVGCPAKMLSSPVPVRECGTLEQITLVMQRMRQLKFGFLALLGDSYNYCKIVFFLVARQKLDRRIRYRHRAAPHLYIWKYLRKQ